MTEKCIDCGKRIDARTRAAGGEHCFDCSTGAPKKEPLEFRGRNGWARFESAYVMGLVGNHDPIAIEMYSRRRGELPPIVISGERAEVRALLQGLIDQIDGQVPREVSEKAEALRGTQA